MLVLSLSFAVLAYGYELVSFSLSLDEEFPPMFAELGREDPWSIALYRWGRVALNYAIIGGSNLPFLRLFLALCLLSVTATVYANMLSITREARYFFSLTFVTVPTFAYALTFSYVSIEFVLACLLFVLGLKCLVDANGARTHAKASQALVLWVLAPAFYQDYGVLLTAYLVHLFFRVAAGVRIEPWEPARVGLVLVASAALYLALSMVLAWAFSVQDERYLWAALPSSGASADVGTFWKKLSHVYVSGSVYGTRSLRVAAIGLPLLSLMSRVPAGRRAGLVLLSFGICLAPAVYGLGTMPPMRACSGLLFVAASFAAFAVERSVASVAFFVKCLVVYLALGNCVAITNIFQFENAVWQADKVLAAGLAQRIYGVAPDVHDADGKVRILFVGSYSRPNALDLPGSQSWVGMFDTWGRNHVVRRQRAMNHAGFPDFRLASREDYDANLTEIAMMPAWPYPGSVSRVGDVVVVKLGEANGFENY